MRACLQEVNKVRGQRTVWRWFRESRQSELVVILGEDFAALLGLALALIAVLMTMLTGNPMWDGLGSMWIGVVLIAVAIGIGREIMALLIGQSAEPADRGAPARVSAESRTAWRRSTASSPCSSAPR